MAVGVCAGGSASEELAQSGYDVARYGQPISCTFRLQAMTCVAPPGADSVVLSASCVGRQSDPGGVTGHISGGSM